MIAARILSFCEALRKNGVRAAEQEVIDAFTALDALGDDAFVERDRLLALFAATLAKSQAEEEILARVFALHFDVDVDAATARPIADLLRERGIDPGALDALLAELGDDEDLLRALLEGDAARLMEIVRAGLEDSDLEGLQSPLQVAYFTQRVMQRLNAQGIDERMLLEKARAAAFGVAGEGAVAAAQWEAAERLRRSVRRAVENELQKRTVAKPAAKGSLLDRDLRTVDAADVEELRRLVRRLAQRLRERLVVRRKRARRGRIDVRRILRRSVATDAIPVRIELVRRRPEKPDVIVLCDVSDSVRQASLFMLELTAALGDVLRRTRSFVFVDKIADVTPLFQPGSDVDEAVNGILRGDVVSVGANSDYGRALRQFWDAAAGSITRRSTVVILGDGRSNYRAPEDWILGEIKKRARRLLWLTPEERGTWGFGDSEMIRYARHADAIFVVRSAADLGRAIDRIAR